MLSSWRTLIIVSLAVFSLIGSSIGGGAQVRAATVGATATATVKAGATATASSSAHASVSVTPTAQASVTGSHTATPVVKGTPVPAKATGSATPKAAPTQVSGLPAAVVLESGLRQIGTGFDAKKALQMANALVPSLYVIAPSYVPKGFTLELIHVDPAQDQQTPAAAFLQYVPTSLKSDKGAYATFYVNMKNGLSTVIFPGAKPQIVTIDPGKKGAGIVKGTVVDVKPKHGNEIIHVLWTRVTISYDISSNVTQSKLTAKDLIAVAASM